MAGGPRIETVVQFFEHDCNCDYCDFDPVHMDLRGYVAVCCGGLPRKLEGSMMSRMELHEHLLHAHDIDVGWESIPYDEPRVCFDCKGYAALGELCYGCHGKGWQKKN